MKRYFCPFCCSRYQLYKTRSDGVLICGQCGDPLMKKKIINYRQLFGLILSLVFLTPLLIMITSLIEEFTKQSEQRNSLALVLMKKT